MTDEEAARLRVCVLAGGWSDEREVSLSSGREVASALGEAGFRDVTLLDVAAKDFLQRVSQGGYDVAFVAMHGRWGEDGCVQGLLELLGIPYTFSGVLASAVGTEKEVAKALYREAGIPTPAGTTLPAGHVVSGEEASDIAGRLGLPLFVKPAANGSSFGVSRVERAEELPPAVAKAGAEGQNVLVEACVEGTEITVPVIGTAEPRALPAIEIVTGAAFYDSKVKYEPGELHHVIPARLPEHVYEYAQELAVRAHKALGCREVSRSDFIVDADGTPWILETNTIPGMTAASLLPDSARHAGIEFPQLCRMFVEWALERADDGRDVCTLAGRTA